MNRISIHSEIGPREHLEDAAMGWTLCGPSPNCVESCALAVFDGVGGEQGGEVASALARESLRHSLGDTLLRFILAPDSDRPPPDKVMACLYDALCSANNKITQQQTVDPHLSNMASTVVAAVMIDRLLCLAWAGDSRGYRWRNGALECLTTDHTPLEPCIRSGLLTRAEAQYHPSAHVITQCLGMMSFVPETRIIRLEEGDVLLFCSDGLTDVISDVEICRLITHHQQTLSFSSISKQLALEALNAGTQDNTTCLCCEVMPFQQGSFLRHRTLIQGYRFPVSNIT